jgi:hypothetical protein
MVFRKSSIVSREHFDGEHRFEHWHRDIIISLVYIYNLSMRYFNQPQIEGGFQKYRHTRISIESSRAIKRAVQISAFLEDLPYARYERRGRFSDPESK